MTLSPCFSHGTRLGCQPRYAASGSTDSNSHGNLNGYLDRHGLWHRRDRCGLALTVVPQDGVITIATIDRAPRTAPQLATAPSISVICSFSIKPLTA